MKRFEEMTYTEKNEIAALFAAWLKRYTHKVIVAVMERRDEIIANEFAMSLLRELKARQEVETAEFAREMYYFLDDCESFKEYDPHSHPLTHSGSYRDILYDMYIKGI